MKKTRIDVFSFPETEQEYDEWMTSPLRETSEGFLKGRAIVTNIGVFPYITENGDVLRELRLPEEVFSKESLDSLAMKPITNDHPNEQVNVDNVKELQVGTLGEDIRRDEFHVSAPVSFTDKLAIADINSGKLALSCGYSVDLEFKSGTWLGQQYDAIQRNIRYNHVALVERGRAGDAAVLRKDRFDAACIEIQSKTDSEVTKMLKSYILRDGSEVQVEEKAIQEIATLKADSDKLQKKLEEVEKSKAEMEAKLDTANDKAEKFEKELKAHADAMPEVIAAAVKARKQIEDACDKLGVEIGDKSDLELKKEIILSSASNKDGLSEKLDKADIVYIDARFDAVCEGLPSSTKADENLLEDKEEKNPSENKNDAADAMKRHRERILNRK